MIVNAPEKTGIYQCRYTAIVEYDGKEEFYAYTPKMNVPRQKTEQETEAIAIREAEGKIDDFFSAHFPDDTPRPKVKGVRLGAVTFIPDDYEWRRGY